MQKRKFKNFYEKWYFKKHKDQVKWPTLNGVKIIAGVEGSDVTSTSRTI